MSNSQILLTLGALALFMAASMMVNRNYLNAVEQTISHQTNLDALNYGLTIAEEFFMTEYDSLDSYFGNLNDVTNPASRLVTSTLTEDSLYATVSFNDKVLPHGVNGTIATISVFSYQNDDYVLQAQVPAALTDM